MESTSENTRGERSVPQSSRVTGSPEVKEAQKPFRAKRTGAKGAPSSSDVKNSEKAEEQLPVVTGLKVRASFGPARLRITPRAMTMGYSYSIQGRPTNSGPVRAVEKLNVFGPCFVAIVNEAGTWKVIWTNDPDPRCGPYAMLCEPQEHCVQLTIGGTIVRLGADETAALNVQRPGEPIDLTRYGIEPNPGPCWCGKDYLPLRSPLVVCAPCTIEFVQLDGEWSYCAHSGGFPPSAIELDVHRTTEGLCVSWATWWTAGVCYIDSDGYCLKLKGPSFVPAPRLVGIEPNPGPSSRPPTASRDVSALASETRARWSRMLRLAYIHHRLLNEGRTQFGVIPGGADLIGPEWRGWIDLAEIEWHQRIFNFAIRLLLIFLLLWVTANLFVPAAPLVGVEPNPGPSSVAKFLIGYFALVFLVHTVGTVVLPLRAMIFPTAAWFPGPASDATAVVGVQVCQASLSPDWCRFELYCRYLVTWLRDLLIQQGVEPNPGPPKRSPGRNNNAHDIQQALADLTGRVQGLADAQAAARVDDEARRAEAERRREEAVENLLEWQGICFDVGQAANLSYPESKGNYAKWFLGLHSIQNAGQQECEIINPRHRRWRGLNESRQRIVPEYRVMIDAPYAFADNDERHEHLRRDDITAHDVLANVYIVHFSRDVNASLEFHDVRYWKVRPWHGPLPADGGSLLDHVNPWHTSHRQMHTKFKVSLAVLTELLHERVCVPTAQPSDVQAYAAARLSNMGHVKYDRNDYIEHHGDWRANAIDLAMLYHAYRQEQTPFRIRRTPAAASASTDTASGRSRSLQYRNQETSVQFHDTPLKHGLLGLLLSLLGLLFLLLRLLVLVLETPVLLWLDPWLAFSAQLQFLTGPGSVVSVALLAAGSYTILSLPQLRRSLAPKIGLSHGLTLGSANKSFY